MKTVFPWLKTAKYGMIPFMDFKVFILPVLAEIAFIIFCIINPHQTLTAYAVLYLVLVLYYFRHISAKRMQTRLQRERKLWLPLLVGSALAVLIQVLTQKMFTSSYTDGRIAVWTDGTLFHIILFALVSFLLRPVAEEHFFRKAMISFDNKKKMAITAILSLLLNALIYTDFSAYPPSLILFGIAKSVLIALPFTLVYLRTRSASVSIAVHILYALLQDLPGVVYDFARFTLR